MSMPDNQRTQGQGGQGNRQGKREKMGDRDWPRDPNEKGQGSLPQDREGAQGRGEEGGQNTGNTGTRENQNR
jgi:hypothetical protein